MEILKQWFEFESDDEPEPEDTIIGDREFQSQFLSVDKTQKKEDLIFQLEKLKKDKFLLKMKVAAWKNTLDMKLEELKQAELALNEKYGIIWKKREEFCSEADKFTIKFGPFSEWWDAQLEYVTELENFKQKKVEEEKSQTEIENLEKEIEKLEEEHEDSTMVKSVGLVDVHASESGDTGHRSLEIIQENKKPQKKTKRVRFADEVENEDEIKETDGYTSSSENKEFSLVDVNLVKMVKRIRNKQRKRNYLSRFIHNNFVTH